MTGTWMARARGLVADQPPTLAGLESAVRTAEFVSATLARAGDARAGDARAGDARAGDEREGTGMVAASLLCASAARCLEAARPEPAADRTPPEIRDDDLLVEALRGESGGSAQRSLDHLLRDCLDVAVAVLDNEDEPLSLQQVQEISAAVGLLDRARAMCCEVVR